MSAIIETIEQTFADRGSDTYGAEAVTQLQHALQSAQLAREAGAPDTLVAAALLHDIGHILEADALPADCGGNLDDQHETRAHAWLLEHFGAAVADPVRLHVLAKRYLCTVDPGYAGKLSPTSHKSYLDQGGAMSEAELAAFRAEPHHEAALRLRVWDDRAKDPKRETPGIEAFRPHLEAALLRA